jgi:hypothetical protein
MHGDYNDLGTGVRAGPLGTQRSPSPTLVFSRSEATQMFNHVEEDGEAEGKTKTCMGEATASSRETVVCPGTMPHSNLDSDGTGKHTIDSCSHSNSNSNSAHTTRSRTYQNQNQGDSVRFDGSADTERGCCEEDCRDARKGW